MKKICCTISLIFLMITAFGQHKNSDKLSFIYGPSIGYQYQKTSFLKTSFYALTEVNSTDFLALNGGVNWTWQNRKTHVIPELALTYYYKPMLLWPSLKAEVTPYTLTPKVGIGIFNILEIAAGYGFELQQKKNLEPIKGFNFSVGLSVPLNFHFK
ncbi:hypothetical protein ACL9RF_09320 [Sphingobacterium sp. Mn56C]|uniref:hypothetical protein n=1 Tax=Sphingobacterium sp. Mn56C TaxID=3395261 RepID=UPI003BDE3A14